MYTNHLFSSYNNPQSGRFLRLEKSTKSSQIARRKAISIFARENILKMLTALNYHNLSICFADTNVDYLIGNMNRTSCLFELKLFDACFRSSMTICNTMTLNYEQRVVMMHRKYNILRKHKPRLREAIPHLVLPPNESVPFIAEYLEPKVDEYGQVYVITNHDLKKGQIIAIEESFCTVVPPHLTYERCSMCLRWLSGIVIPCTHCTIAIFCSEECHIRATTGYHRFECPLVAFLSTAIGYPSVRLALRTITEAWNRFKTLRQLTNFFKKLKSVPNPPQFNVFDVDFTGPVSADDMFRLVFHGRKNPTDLTDELFLKNEAVFNVAVSGMMLAADYNSKDATSLDIFGTILDIIKHNLPLINFPLTYLADTSNRLLGRYGIIEERHPYCLGIFPFGSLLVHPLQPANVTFASWRNSQVFITTAKVTAGTPLICSNVFEYVYLVYYSY